MNPDGPRVYIIDSYVSPFDNLISLSYSMVVFSANLFRLFFQNCLVFASFYLTYIVSSSNKDKKINECTSCTVRSSSKNNEKQAHFIFFLNNCSLCLVVAWTWKSCLICLQLGTSISVAFCQQSALHPLNVTAALP